MRVVIVGAGDIGIELANSLTRRPRMELAIVDIDQQRCERIAEQIDALVLCGDGADPETLKKVETESADALVATTGSDAINTVIAMLGSRLGVKSIVVKLNDAGLRAACQEIGVRRIIAPKFSAAAEILGALYGFDRLDFSMVVRGGLRLIELGADGAQGKRIGELDLPDGAHTVALLRNNEVLLPAAGRQIARGDVLLILVNSNDVIGRVRKSLGLDDANG